MNNYNFTQSLDGLNNIEADNINVSNLNVGNLVVNTAQITTLSDCNLVNCTSDSPLNPASTVNKSYVDNNFVDRTNNLTQSINGLKTFTNNTNFTGNLITRTNCRINEIDDYTGNTINLTFPMATTVLLRISSGTSMTLNLPQLTVNERGMVFTFLKASNVVNCTVNAYTGQGIVIATDITTPVQSSSTILSADKVSMKLYVGYYQTLTFWVEITEFSTMDRFLFRGWLNPTTSNAVTLTNPLTSTIALRIASGTSMTVTLPSLNANDRGKIFTFVKITTTKFNVIFNTNGTDDIYALNNILGNPKTNSTIFPSSKITCKLAVGFTANTTYWIEVGDYSTFDIDENNGRYVDFTTNGQVISGNKTFSNTTTTNFLFTKDFRWNDAVGGANIQQTYLSNVTFVFVPLFNSNIYGFQCRNAGSVTTTPLTINSASTTISNLLVSNNITAPISLGGTNNIFTNLDTFTGGAIINIGAIKNNINIKCNLNIVESVYNNPTKITTINQEGNSLRFTNNGSTNGDYIFTIIEGTTYNPFIINKTSVDIAGDLIIYDSTQAFTKSLIISVVGNDINFNPDQTLSTTYNFITNDSGGTPTTTLIISSASTTVANPLISNSTATFNNGATFNSVIPTTSLTATSANELVNYSTLTGQNYTTLSAVQSNGNTFTSTNTFTGNLVSTTGLFVQGSLVFENGLKSVNAYLTAVNELTFQPFSPSNSYKFQCLNSSGTADKSLFITFDKTTIQTQLEVAENATFNSTSTFSGDVTLSKTKNNSTYATYNGLNSTYIGYLAEVPPGVYLGTLTNTQYQLGAITLDSTNVGFWTCNYEVEINCSTAGSISKIYVFVSDNNVSTTIPITLPGAKANNFSTQTYSLGDSTYHSGSFSFLQSTATNIYAVQLKIIIASGGFQRKGQIRMLRIL